MNGNTDNFLKTEKTSEEYPSKSYHESSDNAFITLPGSRHILYFTAAGAGIKIKQFRYTSGRHDIQITNARHWVKAR